MNNIVNICFSESAGGNFRVAIRMNELDGQQKVIVLSDDLSHGPIKGEVNIEERINWGSIVDEGEYFASYGADDLKENYNTFYNEISKINDKDTLYLWYGSSQEFCGMLYALELLKDRNLNIYLINATDTIVKYKDKVYLARDAGDVVPQYIDKYTSLKQKLNSNKYKQLLDTWELLKNDNSILRVFKNEQIKSVDENYFDIDVLKYTPKGFRNSAEIVRSIIENSDVEISFDYTFWRVKKLVKLGKIDYTCSEACHGTFESMKIEIKITEEGVKHLSTSQKAMSVWENNKKSLDEEEYMINEYIEEGRLEEKISIAKKLKDVLDSKTIADNTGLTIGQVKNL
ncbi:DUF1835 domain-containing protein [Clostridium tagluense]|uniref:DUF1835 domain-containing protein n=1 Tax=Clostridium tagluense TaxID=360422 RepID=UPI001CF41421|nr:DUF1835 domain-containing protein [Clostridium tagluense]MCB2312821.1 DUF1835 domain-containing protein [Clostridium tagluense]MCB2317587.1 DUF1835 domain-containing protein [Clostridium tagluense]MCB2322323.1 DUF1835 domain-containing protein [Clostridium tagluense]MCB2327326.1 DUF1835 domain-containing protein [Clostridium tagluense]MCB2332045.1 DUF1835 domain-containing protein [Clostridium tagluense]